MPDYRRNRVPGGTYFFTVNLHDRCSSLLVSEINVLRAVVKHVRNDTPFYIDAWVVLPDHMHAIWTLPPGDADYSSRWRSIKKRFSWAMPAVEQRSASRELRGERGIWQRRFWEHTIRDQADYSAHMDYVHFNPVKHGLVAATADWPFSSFHRAVRQGVFAPDWSLSAEPAGDWGESHEHGAGNGEEADKKSALRFAE